jgi:NhaP-type Na+/H+ or K+/H+ antiporter
LPRIGLVIATAVAVAAVTHALWLPWGPAWVLGAAVAPTDATAVGMLARALPRRTVTVLRAESLVNDGTALVIYSLAVGITATAASGVRVGRMGTSQWPFAGRDGSRRGADTGLRVGAGTVDRP